MSERFFAIVNPAAGGGKCKVSAPKALERLRKSGLQIESVETMIPGNAVCLVRDAYREGFRNFIAVGGDGTGFEVVNGLFPLTDSRPSIAFLPMGTGNSFLRDFSNEGADYAEKALIEGKKRACDVIEITHEGGKTYFINILSIGFVADVNSTRQNRFRSFGEFGYVLSVISNLRRLKTNAFPLIVDGVDRLNGPVTFLSINNSRFTGGKMMMAPHADPSDGKADLISVGPMGRLSLLRAFPKIFSGNHIHLPQVTERKVSHIDFDFHREIDAMVDGEALRLSPKSLRVLPGAFDARV